MEQKFDLDIFADVQIKTELDIGPTVLQHRSICVPKSAEKLWDYTGDGEFSIPGLKSIKPELEYPEHNTNSDHHLSTEQAVAKSALVEQPSMDGANVEKFEIVNVLAVEKEFGEEDEALPSPLERESRRSAEESHDSDSPVGRPQRAERELHTITLLEAAAAGAHADGKRFSCDLCGARFKQSSHLMQHQQTHSSEKPFRCESCNAKFKRSTHLIIHKRIHTGEKPFGCEVCDAKFRNSYILKRHKQIHSVERPFGCGICDVKFKRFGDLARHKLVHSDERPFTCEICNVRLRTSSILKQHLRIHTGEKPYDCDVCHVKFKCSSDLLRHKRVHTDDKPFNCETCNAKCRTSSNLKQHKLTHIVEKPFSCQKCDKKFTRFSYLKQHNELPCTVLILNALQKFQNDKNC